MSPFFSVSSSSFACSFIQFLLSFLMLHFTLSLISNFLLSRFAPVYIFFCQFSSFCFFPCLLRDPVLLLTFSKTQYFLTCFYIYIFYCLPDLCNVCIFVLVASTENLFFSSIFNSSRALSI